MYGVGFYLGLGALNYGEVGRPILPDSQWYEMMFTMGVQCQFSCACVTSLLAVRRRVEGGCGYHYSFCT